MKQAIENFGIELIPFAPANSASGIGRYTLEIYKYLQDQLPVSIKQFEFPILADRFKSLRSFPIGIKEHISESIIHFPQIMGSALAIWRPFPRMVATVHDLGILVCPQDKLIFSEIDRILLGFQYRGLKLMNRLVVHSRRTKGDLINKLGIEPDKISITPSSVDCKQFRPIPESRRILSDRYGLVFRENIPYIIYVGSELPRKNLDLLLESMAILKSHSQPLHLIKIGGSGGDRWRKHFMAQIETLGLQQDVTLVGTVAESDLPVFYNAVDFTVTTTLLEGGFAWVSMEGMACGKPSVATTAALIPDHAHKAAIIVNSYDPGEFAQAMMCLIDNASLRKEMGDSGLSLIQNHSWENEIKELLKIYQLIWDGQS